MSIPKGENTFGKDENNYYDYKEENQYTNLFLCLSQKQNFARVGFF